MPILFFVNCERTVLFSVKRDLDPLFSTLSFGSLYFSGDSTLQSSGHYNLFFNILLHFKWQMIFLLKFLQFFTSIHNYGSVILWNLNFGLFWGWRHKLARSWSICVILSDHCIIVPHLNDKWFLFHKLYHPKLLWFIHMVQWYCEILILVHFASDDTCQILKHKCHSEWPLYYCSTF